MPYHNPRLWPTKIWKRVFPGKTLFDVNIPEVSMVLNIYNTVHNYNIKKSGTITGKAAILKPQIQTNRWFASVDAIQKPPHRISHMHTFFKDQSDLNNKNDMLRIMQERTRHETKPAIFGYFFDGFLQPDVYIPYTPITMHSLEKQINFLPK